MIGQYIFIVLVTIVHSVKSSQVCYETDILKEIPSDHLYHKLKHPIVIGHMGNIKEYQENSLEGIRNLIDIKAGGVHMHVRLTEDDHLILFQEDNVYRMTGEDFDVLDLPYSEMKKMNLLKTIYYYSNGDYRSKKVKTYKYRSTAKIPLLSTALGELKGKGLLIYIEMMPNHVPPTGPLDRYMALTTAKLLSKMIKDYGMEKEVLVVSRDAFKLFSVAYNYPSISTGWLVDGGLYVKKVADGIKENYVDLRGNTACYDKPGGFAFTKYLVSTGYISKVVNASFIDASISIYDDKNYFETAGKSSLKDVVKANYGLRTSLGAFDIFSWNETKLSSNTNDQDGIIVIDSDEIQKKEDEKFVLKVVNYGVSRIITNDVNRVKQALNEVIVSSKATTLQSYPSMFIVFTILISKLIVTLIYV